MGFDKERYARDPEYRARRKAEKKKYYERNKEKCLAQKLNWQIENKKLKQKTYREWYEKNKIVERFKIYNRVGYKGYLFIDLAQARRRFLQTEYDVSESIRFYRDAYARFNDKLRIWKRTKKEQSKSD